MREDKGGGGPVETGWAVGRRTEGGRLKGDGGDRQFIIGPGGRRVTHERSRSLLSPTHEGGYEGRDGRWAEGMKGRKG